MRSWPPGRRTRTASHGAVPAVVVADVMEDQVAHGDIERARIKGQVTGVRVHELHPVGSAFKQGIALVSAVADRLAADRVEEVQATGVHPELERLPGAR